MIHIRSVASIVSDSRILVRSYSSSRCLKQKEGWDDKLRILFCGTGDFSIESLKALHIESKKTNQIKSIDVVTRKDKRTGRGLKTLTSPPIKQSVANLGLPLHQIDTFTGWTPPDVNLIIAVSFGLLIPLRILNSSKYAGLNVHPSLLPDLKGAAPTQWTIILGRQQTGVSIQTLHPTKFDEGIVLDQTPGPILLDGQMTELALSNRLAPLGAEMLVKAIRNRLYLPPYASITPLRQSISPAPKTKTEDKVMDFEKLGRHEICRRWRALGPLHAFAEDVDGKKVRIKCDQLHTATTNNALVGEIRDSSREQARLRGLIPIGVPHALLQRESGVTTCSDPLMVNTKDGTIYIGDITVEGKTRGPAVQRAAQAKLFGPPTELDGLNERDRGSMYYRFLNPLAIE